MITVPVFECSPRRLLRSLLPGDDDPGLRPFDLASLRADAPSRTVGLVLLGPPAVFLVMTAGLMAGYAPEWSTFLISAMQAGGHFAVGLVLRNGSVPDGRGEPGIDSSAD